MAESTQSIAQRHHHLTYLKTLLLQTEQKRHALNNHKRRLESAIRSSIQARLHMNRKIVQDFATLHAALQQRINSSTGAAEPDSSRAGARWHEQYQARRDEILRQASFRQQLLRQVGDFKVELEKCQCEVEKWERVYGGYKAEVEELGEEIGAFVRSVEKDLEEWDDCGRSVIEFGGVEKAAGGSE